MTLGRKHPVMQTGGQAGNSAWSSYIAQQGHLDYMVRQDGGISRPIMMICSQGRAGHRLGQAQS